MSKIKFQSLKNVDLDDDVLKRVEEFIDGTESNIQIVSDASSTEMYTAKKNKKKQKLRPMD